MHGRICMAARIKIVTGSTAAFIQCLSKILSDIYVHSVILMIFLFLFQVLQISMQISIRDQRPGQDQAVSYLFLKETVPKQ